MGRRRNGKHGANGLTIAVLVFAIIGILVMAGYLYVLGLGLATLGFAKLVPLVAVLIASLAGVAFTFAKANGVLFGYKDYDFIMSLPVKKTVIIASRVACIGGTFVRFACSQPGNVRGHFVLMGSDGSRCKVAP